MAIRKLPEYLYVVYKDGQPYVPYSWTKKTLYTKKGYAYAAIKRWTNWKVLNLKEGDLYLAVSALNWESLKIG